MTQSRVTTWLRELGRWTPDFSAGVAELEIEAMLTRFHLLHRASIIGSGALQVLARPEEVERPLLAWTSLGLEGADTALIWRRTRQWRTLLAPDVASVDQAIGLVSIALGSLSMTKAAQSNTFAWTNRSLAMRGAAVPLTTRGTGKRAMALGVLLLPHMVKPVLGNRRQTVIRLAPRLALGTAVSIATTELWRRRALAIDNEASQAAARHIESLLDLEQEQFASEVLAPTAATLRSIREHLDTDGGSDAAGATAAARSEEKRLREWLRESNDLLDESPEIDMAADIEAGDLVVQGISRRILAAARAGTSLLAINELRRRNNPPAAAAAALWLRVALGALVVSDRFVAEVGEDNCQRMLAASDVAAVIAAGEYQLQNPTDRDISGWAEEVTQILAFTTATMRHDAPSARHTAATIGAVRAVVILMEERPLFRRLAAIADETTLLRWTVLLAWGIVENALEHSRKLIKASADLAVSEHQPAVRDARLDRHAMVHDGPAQVLHGVAAGELEPDRLVVWIDQELARIESILGDDGPIDRPIEQAIASLAEEFRGRGLLVTVEAPAPPALATTVNDTITEIVREALNNTLKHTDSATAACRVSDDGERVVISVVDFPSSPKECRPGSGMGTRTMSALAERIAAKVEWVPTPGGGTEVRVVLEP